MASQEYRLTWHSAIREIPADSWNALTAPLRTPLLEWEWLNELEQSGSMSPDTGWIPTHMGVWDGDRLVAAAPLYVRTHSMGDFVFDFAPADVAQQMGIPYYPKLVGMRRRSADIPSVAERAPDGWTTSHYNGIRHGGNRLRTPVRKRRGARHRRA